jgi:3-phenylpropionate/cinnamic acid dioxygenase small subunit
MDPADVIAIHQLYGLYGHVMDDRDWTRLPELFTEDCIFDATALGVPLMEGRAAIAATTETSPATPLGHHVTNVFVAEIDGDAAVVRAKALGTYSRGRAFSGDYEDRLVRTPDGWRISWRLNRPPRAAMS